MDHDFAKSMKELDKSYTMLEELRLGVEICWWDTVRDLKKVKVFNYASNKTSYPKISKMKFVLNHEEDGMRLKTRRVKIKGVNQESNVYPTHKIRHENTGRVLFK